MKRYVILLTIFLTLGIIVQSHATPISFTNTVKFIREGTATQEDYTDHGWGAVNMLSDKFNYREGLSFTGRDYVTWTHHLDQDYITGTIVSGSLTVYLKDDERDSIWRPGSLEFGFGWTEDGKWKLGAVNTGTYTLEIDPASLEDGLFAATIASLSGDFFIRKSELTVTFIPNPEPATAALLLGVAMIMSAISWIRFRRKKEND